MFNCQITVAIKSEIWSTLLTLDFLIKTIILKSLQHFVILFFSFTASTSMLIHYLVQIVALPTTGAC